MSDKTAFGYSYYMQMYNTRVGAADDLELHYRFLEELVERLGMVPMSAPYVMHGPRKNGIELFPDKAGCSGWIPLITSGIQIHSLEPSHFITLDVYSCKEFDPELVVEWARRCFGFESHDGNFSIRGVGYLGDQNAT